MNENDPKNKLLIESCAVSIPRVLPRVELVQPIPTFLPTPLVPPRPYTILERTFLPTTPQIRPMDIKTKPIVYQIPHVRNLKSKSISKQPRVTELAKGLQTYAIMKDFNNLHP